MATQYCSPSWIASDAVVPDASTYSLVSEISTSVVEEETVATAT